MTLYLHVGAHKTGTTTIQQFSSARRQLLLEKGLFYPDFGEIGRPSTTGHHAFANAIAGQVTKPPFLESQLVAFADLCARHSGDHNILVSAEPIFRHLIGGSSFGEGHRTYIERLADRFGAIADVVPVVCLRRQDTFAASMVQEQIKTTTMTRSLGQFAADNAEFMDFEKHVDLYEDVFGSAKVFVFERLIGGDGLLRNFFRELGVDLSEEEAAFKAVNPSLHPAVVLYKLRLNERAGTTLRRSSIPQSLLFRVSAELFGTEKRSLFSEDELDRIFAAYGPSNARLAHHLGLPPESRLFPERGPLPPRYERLSDSDFHKIEARVGQLLAERQANRIRNRPRKARPKSLWRRVLRRLGVLGGAR